MRAINNVSGDDTRGSECHEAIFTGQLCEIINDCSFPRISGNQLQVKRYNLATRQYAATPGALKKRNHTFLFEKKTEHKLVTPLYLVPHKPCSSHRHSCRSCREQQLHRHQLVWDTKLCPGRARPCRKHSCAANCCSLQA